LAVPNIYKRLHLIRRFSDQFRFQSWLVVVQFLAALLSRGPDYALRGQLLLHRINCHILAGWLTGTRGRNSPVIGTVKWLSSRKGYGVLHPADGGFYVCVRVSALERAGIVELKQGQKVKFDIVADKRTGQLFADNLSILPDAREKMRGGASKPVAQPTSPFVGRLLGQLASRIGARRETLAATRTRLR
jgi:cold shock protein